VAIDKFDREVKKRFRGANKTPWMVKTVEIGLMGAALAQLSKKVSSREMGTRFEDVFKGGSRPRTHHYFVLASAYGQYALLHAQSLGKPQRLAYMKLLAASNMLWSKSFRSMSDVCHVQQMLNDALAHVELSLPSTELDIKLHNMVHLVEKISKAGPLWTSSMFVYESMWACLVRWASKKDTPELTILRNFSDYEYASLALLDNPNSEFNGKLTDSLESQVQLWLPSKMAAKDRVCSVDVRDELVPVISLLDRQWQKTLLIDLHQLYQVVTPEYRTLWIEYCTWLYENKRPPGLGMMTRDKERCPDTGAHLHSFKASALVKALLEWNVWDPPGRELSTAEKRLCTISTIVHEFKSMRLNGVVFGTSNALRKSDKHWALCMVTEDDERMYLANLQGIYTHEGPDAVTRCICVCKWHASAQTCDPHTLLPSFCGELYDNPFGNAWLCEHLAPVNFIVQPHPHCNQLLVLHRDPRMVELAGYKCPVLP
jgi:hypothetical protein